MLLANEQLTAALERLSQSALVLVPQEVNQRTQFAPYAPGVTPDFSLVNVTLPPKDMLFPQTEALYAFRQRLGRLEYTSCADTRQRVVFGIRPCDAQSIACMDQVFLTGEFVDAAYAARREGLTMVAMACAQAGETCFCESMGLSPAACSNADALLTPTQSGYLLTAQTPKGEALAGELRELLGPGEESPLPAARCSLRPSMEGVAQAMAASFESDVWDKIYRPCLTCGACTYLCPTCYCFDVNTQEGKEGGETYRCWDSCMFSEYTRMAGGHNPRPSKKERVRNRFMHKLAWFEERYGHTLCVGCGRCVAHCPAGMDITRIMEQAREAQAV